MKCLFALVLAVCFLSIVSATAPLKNMDSQSIIPDQYIVVFHQETDLLTRDNHVDELALRLSENEKIINRFSIGTLIGYSAVLNKETLAGELEHPNVRYIEADQICTANEANVIQNGATWGISRISVRNGPAGSTYTYFQSAGQGVYAYVIDTGILYNHNDFGGRAHYGTNTVPNENDADGNGHGTHVASTIGGTTYGVAKKVTLLAVKVLSSGGSGSWSGVIQGVDWVTKNHTGRGDTALSVANMSLGGGASDAVDEAVNNSINKGVHYALAAGNDNKDACTTTPARVPNANTVGATTSSDAKASYSNFGRCLDIWAPGSSITAAYIGSRTATNSLSGTSMASPHVAGVIAVRLAHLRVNGGNAVETPAQISSWLKSAATPNKVTGIPANSGSPTALLFSPST